VTDETKETTEDELTSSNIEWMIWIFSTASQYATVAESLASKEAQVFSTLFYNPEYTISALKKLVDFIGGCKSRNICGGCRARAYNYFNDILAPDPGCVNNYSEWLKIKKELPENAQELPDGRILIDLESAG